MVIFAAAGMVAGITTFSEQAGMATIIGGLVLAVAMLAVFLMYANLINDTSKAIRNPEHSDTGTDDFF